MALKDAVAVYNAANNIEAHLIHNILKDAGVEAFVAEDVSQVGVWMFGLLPEIHKPQVWVDRSDIERAKPILEDFENRQLQRQAANLKQAASGEATLEAVCEACGQRSVFPSAQEGTVQDCPHCGDYMDVEGTTGHADSIPVETLADETGADQSRPLRQGPPASRLLGQGEFPPELDCVNWGAVFWGALWSLVYGIWPWFLGLIALRLCAFLFFPYFNATSWGSSWIGGLVASVLFSVVFWCALAILGVRANQLVWLREKARSASEGGAPVPQATVSQYIKAQRTWAVSGMAVTLGLEALGIASTFPNRAIPSLISGACGLAILGVLFVYDRNRSYRM
jgi:hypothetical protein